MDFANRGNRPTQSPQQGNFQNEQPATPSFQPASQPKKERKGLNSSVLASMFMLFGVVVLIIAVLIGVVFGSNGSTNAEADLIKTDKYQAVFLDSPDGQVYFGKLGIYNSDLYILTDIYYVRVEQPIQPEGVNQPAQPNISLAKLGNELHGPEDVMFIARDKVLYWENLKDDGQVVTAITEFKANGGQTTNQQQNDGSSNAQPADNNANEENTTQDTETNQTTTDETDETTTP